MREELISIETAILAKEKGFKIMCKNKYVIEDLGLHFKGMLISNGSSAQKHQAYAPTQSLLQRWLREKHKLIIIIKYIWEYDTTPYAYFIYKEGISEPINVWKYDFKTYEESLKHGLWEALKLLP